MPAIGGDPFAEDEAEEGRLLIGFLSEHIKDKKMRKGGETTCQLGCQIREMHHQQQVLSEQLAPANNFLLTSGLMERWGNKT